MQHNPSHHPTPRINDVIASGAALLVALVLTHIGALPLRMSRGGLAPCSRMRGGRVARCRPAESCAQHNEATSRRLRALRTSAIRRLYSDPTRIPGHRGTHAVSRTVLSPVLLVAVGVVLAALEVFIPAETIVAVARSSAAGIPLCSIAGDNRPRFEYVLPF